MEIKTIDNQGRIVLPKKWRNRYIKGKEAIIILKGDTVEIKPLGKVDLTKCFDRLEVDLESDLSNWHRVRKELRGQ